MKTNMTLSTRLQVVEGNQKPAAENSDRPNYKCAADAPAEFHWKVVRAFRESLDVKQVAAETKISARMVIEILLARDFVRQQPARMMRRVA